MYNGVYGSAIPQSKTVEKSVYEYTDSKVIPKTVLNKFNLHLVAFVINKKTNEVINVQEAAVGKDSGF